MKASIFFAAALSICLGTTVVIANNSNTDTIEYNLSNYVTETRDVSQFDRVKVSNSISVNIVCDAVQSVEVKADETIIADVRTEVHNGELNIYLNGKHRFFGSSKKSKIEVFIAVPTLTAVDLNGASEMIVGEFSSNDFTASVSGASNLDIRKLTAKGIVDIDASGASDVDINGMAQEVLIRASGASDVSTRGLSASIAKVHASGASDVDVTAQDEIIVECSGASDVDYYGRPKAVDINTSGASDVNGH